MIYDAEGNTNSTGGKSFGYDAEGNITAVDGGGTAQYVYDALNHRVRAAANGSTKEYVFNAAGQRVSIWNAGIGGQLQGQYYWGTRPVAYYAGGATHFQHQDWVGTERMRTSYNGAVEAKFTSLPYGDAQTTAAGSDTDAYHFAGLDYDSETQTDHAQFRQYNATQGRWMSPDPYSGSYDFTNPQSLNRYSYVMNNPLSFTDTSGLDVCDNWWCDGGGGGGGWGSGDGGDPGGCDPLVQYCDGIGYDGDLGGGSTPNPKDFVDLDPHHIMMESLGLPPGMLVPSGDLLDIFGIGSGTTCEFGACGNIGDSFTTGEATAPISWCTQNPAICAIPAEIGSFFKAIPAVAASAMLLSMTGDKAAAPDRCQKIISAAQAACVEELYGGNSNGHGQSGPSLFRKCVRQKIAGSGCSY